MNDLGYLSPGHKLKERYEIIREIGRGGYSIVYEATDLIAAKPVAVKLLVPPPAVARIALERLHREVRAVRSISSPYLVPVYDLLEEGPWTFIIMELISGGDLQMLVAKGKISPDSATRIGVEIGEVLQAAHKRGILHRDVKPQNILIGEDGWARLTDFGSAKLEGQATLTRTGAFVGTLDYTAPEVLDGQRADARSDLYSLGMTLYYALTGKLPARSSAHLPPPKADDGHHPQDAETGIPEWLGEVIAHATRANPATRFPTAERFVEALRQRSAGIGQPRADIKQCLICGNTDPFGLWICVGCGGLSAPKGEIFIFLERPESLKERKKQAIALKSFIRIRSAPFRLRKVAAGIKPLIKVASQYADRIVDQLFLHNIAAHAVPAGRIWAQFPRDFYLLLLAVITAGIAAGLIEQPSLLWITPLVASNLFLIALLLIQRPLLQIRKSRSTLPAPVQARVVQAMSQLSSKGASSLLADLVAFSQQLFEQETIANEDLRSDLAELLTNFSTAAVNLNQLETTLIRLDAQKERHPAMPAGWIEGYAHCEEARDSLVQKFLEAIAIVGSVQSHSILGSKGIVEQLTSLTNDLDAEMEIQEKVAAQMKELEIR